MSITRRLARPDSCWTCKLRRKKCDEHRPTCRNCDSLQIACEFGPKPRWMDGGLQQKAKSLRLQMAIKRNAAIQREKASIPSKHAHKHTTHQLVLDPDLTASDDSIDAAIANPRVSTMGTTPAVLERSASFTLLEYNHQQNACSNGQGHASALETDFVMKYLDFVFPALFPFYRPAFFDTGRTWVLLLLKGSKIAYHSILSLSAYFFTTTLTDAYSDEDYWDCKIMRWNEVEEQTNKCFEGIRTDLSRLRADPQSTIIPVLDKVYIMESIVQVLIFEIVLGNSAAWKSHLTAAIALFEEITSNSAQTSSNLEHAKLQSVLLEIGPSSWSNRGFTRHIWSPDQAGFRFFAGLLVFIDVMASTAIQESPKLFAYHPFVLAKVDDGPSVVGEAEVRLSGIVGCRNWIIHSIARISALASWKQEQVAANSLSAVELVGHASGITADLKTGILELHKHILANNFSDSNHHTPWDTHSNPSASLSSNLIWALAAQLYLTVVMSGWQISNGEVRANVARILTLFQSIPPAQLRAFAWPLCVAGCLASEEEEAYFLAILEKQDRALMAGALAEARKILQEVWLRRNILDTSTWNLASCFNVPGHPVLLV